MIKSSKISSATASFNYTLIELPCGNTVTVGKKDSYELVFITSGIGVYTEKAIDYRLSRGSLLLSLPGEKRELSVSDSSLFEMYSVSFTRRDLISEAEHILDSVLSLCTDGEAIISSSYAPERLMAIFERFESADGMPKEEKAVYFKMLISEIIVFLSLADSTGGVLEERALGARVAKYLDENLDRVVSLDTLARRFFVSKFYLCRAFKKHNGISVHSYINNKRVMYAKQLIESGESASGAAYKVGFGDYSAFYRAYVKIFGKSPTLDVSRGGES